MDGEGGGKDGGGAYRLATLDEISHLEQCILENKYVEYQNKIIKNKYEKEENTMNTIPKSASLVNKSPA